jgi:hypothetical protein
MTARRRTRELRNSTRDAHVLERHVLGGVRRLAQLPAPHAWRTRTWRSEASAFARSSTSIAGTRARHLRLGRRRPGLDASLLLLADLSFVPMTIRATSPRSGVGTD